MTTETVENTEAQEQERPSFPDPVAEASFKQLSQLITNRNAQVAKINAVKGDRLSLSKELEENSESEAAVNARARRDKAQAELDEAVMDLHKAVQPEIESLLADAEKSVSGIEEAVKEADGKIKPGTTYFKKMYGENLAKHLPSLERLKGFSTRGAGSSGRRLRGYTIDVTIDGETTNFENAASAAKFLDVETSVVQAAFFEAAGNPEKVSDAPDKVSFTVEYTDTDEDDNTETYTAQVVATRESKDAAPAEGDESGTSEDE